MMEKFQSAGGSQLREFCSHKTKEDCRRQRGSNKACSKLHFRKIIQMHTDENLGDCSFLNTCFHMETCKFVHYEIDDSVDEPQAKLVRPVKLAKPFSLQPRSKLTPAQWINCDLRQEWSIRILIMFRLYLRNRKPLVTVNAPLKVANQSLMKVPPGLSTLALYFHSK